MHTGQQLHTKVINFYPSQLCMALCILGLLQGHGHRRYRQGHGPKLQKFKGFMQKAASFGKQHILPHLQEIGTNTLLDIMEGKMLEIP